MTNQNKNILHMPTRPGQEYRDTLPDHEIPASITTMTEYRNRKLANVAFLPMRNPETEPDLPHLAEVRNFPTRPHTPHGPEAA